MPPCAAAWVTAAMAALSLAPSASSRVAMSASLECGTPLVPAPASTCSWAGGKLGGGEVSEYFYSNLSEASGYLC